MTLESRVLASFESHFRQLRFSMALPTRLASEIASGLAVGTYKEIFAQVDPMRVGDTERAVKIAWEYGERLARSSKNAKEGTLARLVAEYPSHSFVIDREEARELFHKVDDPTEAERSLAVMATARAPFSDETGMFYISTEVPDDKQQEASDQPLPSN
jgi:hypothetical protein